MTCRIHTSRHQKPKNLLPIVQKVISSSQNTTLGSFCRMTFLTFKETSFKYKAVGDRKYKLFEPSSENQQNADPEDRLNF